MPEFDPRNYPYSSHRNVVYARKAMACTSIPQGAQIGLDVMKAGGNAVDAAIATAAALTVYDMCKAIDKRMTLGEIHLVEKHGGKSGDFYFEEQEH